MDDFRRVRPFGLRPAWRAAGTTSKRRPLTGESEALAAGYTLSQTEGDVFSSSAPGLSPMKLYWHGGREDDFTTVTRESAATSSGYGFIRTEGHTFATRP